MLETYLPNAAIHVVAPGRVNLLGEHVDYNGGPVLPAAIDRAVTLAAIPRMDRLVRLQALDLKESVTFDLGMLDEKLYITGKPLPRWALYPAGVAWVLEGRDLPVSGMDAVFTSTIPIGSGLSSSAAVELAFAVAWRALGGWEASPMTLALIGQQAENEYVGVNCGIMDQFASAHGVEGHALYFDTRSLDWHPVPLPPRTTIVIADSGVRRSLVTSAYNERRAACEEALRRLQEFLPDIQALRDVSPAQFAQYANRLPETIRKRAQHIVEECDRVDQAMLRLEAGDGSGFGELMYAGHRSLRDLYEVSTPELDSLVDLASQIPGCLGARLTGAGFGGCTVNLVAENQAESFIETLKRGYQERVQRQAQVYLCRASEGAHVMRNA